MSNPEDLTEYQKNKLILEMHHALVGDPFDPQKPGISALVGRHHMALYGPDESTGLVADSVKYKRLFWIGTGIFLAFQIIGGALFTWYVTVKAVH